MRTIVKTEEGVLELNYMWIPTWLGMNGLLKKELEKELADKIVGLPMDDASLDKIDDMVITTLVEKFPNITGLRNLLRALHYVHFCSSNDTKQAG